MSFGSSGRRAVVAEVAERLARREAADEHAVAAVREPGGALEDVVEIEFLQPAAAAVERIANRRACPTITSASRSSSAR